MSTYCTPHSLSINLHVGQKFYNINRERSQTTKHMPLLQLKSSQSHRISWLESTLFPIKCGKIRSSQHLSYNIPTYGQFSLTEKKYFFVNVKNVKCAVDREKEMLVDCTVEGLYIKHLIASLQQTSKVFILFVPVVGKEKLATVKDRAWGLKKKNVQLFDRVSAVSNWHSLCFQPVGSKDLPASIPSQPFEQRTFLLPLVMIFHLLGISFFFRIFGCNQVK